MAFFRKYAGLILIFLSLLLIQCQVDSHKPVNIIFIVPDGFSYGIWGAVRVVLVGMEGETNLDKMPHTARYTSYAVDNWISESASTMTAMMTGVKVNTGVLAEDHTAVFKKTPGNKVQTLMEYAHLCGMSTGIITTTEIYNATPAACYAHSHDRTDYLNIALQLVEGEFTPDIILGGGRKYMKSKSYLDPEAGKLGLREDYRDLTSELVSEGYIYLESENDFKKWNPNRQKKVIGLFAYENMALEILRKNDKMGEPALWEMTEKVLQALKDDKDGFFLMVEAGRIDHMGHHNEPEALLYECIAFDKTVGVALDFLKENPNTLVLIAADHGCGGAMGIGMQSGNNPVTAEGIPGPYTDNDNDGFPDSFEVDNKLVISWASDKNIFANENSKKLPKGQHTSEDLLLFAAGEGSRFVNGFLDNTDIYNIMKLMLPAEEGEKAVVSLDGEAIKSDIEVKSGEVVFTAVSIDNKKGRLDIYDMEGNLLKSIDGVLENGAFTFRWNPSRSRIEIPGLFKYRYYMGKEMIRAHTFIVR